MSIDPELPWGNWLRIEAHGGHFAYVDDATGQSWPSPRSALWNGRLGMGDRNGGPPPELLELIHAVLAATVRRVPGHREQLNDLFGGNVLFQRMFDVWLGSSGLAVPQDNGHGIAELTEEGWAVLHLLTATRPYDVRRDRPCAATIAMLGELGLGPEGREARFERLEREAIRWDAAFLRRKEAGRWSIVLTKRAGGPMPVLRTVWSLSFETEGQRDDFYDWLCTRLDRWQAWADLAGDYGSEKLTNKLLGILAGAVGDDSGHVPVQPTGLAPPG
ncbi:hypothetical protein [Sphingomonas sp. CFBP 13706]|uniref:hypothetical protein n=1 Tax=Sphingomonas sp. CFBP 13706 TaxID=2775314 RepID=UPI00177B4556|nr:hypothetical protein [Sphingomonas sp. CFBP 13706]MBD8736222.1 hypothetical protein [Sphingomonas sp. CFBP 13706]